MPKSGWMIFDALSTTNLTITLILLNKQTGFVVDPGRGSYITTMSLIFSNKAFLSHSSSMFFFPPFPYWGCDKT